MIEIKSILGNTLLSVPVLKDAVSHEELMTSDYVQLSWDSEKSDVLPMGAYVEYEGEKYSLLEPYHPTRQNEAAYRYTPQFQSRIMRWQKIIVPVYTYNEDGVTIKSRELDWTFTGTPANAMYMVQQTLRNELGEVWDISVGEDLPETVTITSQSSSIWSVLSDLAEQCETEWWADKKAQSLSLSKCEHGVSVTLEAGKDVKIPSSIRNAEEYHTRFYAFGSARNVTQSEGVVQGSIVNKRLGLNPVKYPDGYKDIKGHFDKGEYVSDLLPEEVLVKTLYFEDVYPSSQLVISDTRRRMRYYLDENDKKIRVGGTDDDPVYDQYAIWYFRIPDFEFSEDMIIENLPLSVAFKSGQLRGREFELAYHPEDKKVADRADVDEDFTVMAGEYEILFDESDGMMIPSADYLLPSDGDEVTLFNIEMPEEYKQSAYIKLEEELDKEIARLMQDNNAYEFDSNPVEFYNNDISVHLGQRVVFINEGKELSTRVQMIEKHLDYPCEQKIRIGNEIVKGSRQQLKDEVRNVGEEVSRMSRLSEYYGASQRGSSRDLMLTMGRFYAMQDTIDMLQGAVEGYTEGINPITVETMAMLVGNEALQFKFTRSTSNFDTIQCPLVYDPAVKKLYAGTCALFHLTLGINEIASVRDLSDYKSWTMEAWQSEIFDDPKKRYYVYAKVEKDGMLGTYVCSETTIGMEQYSQYYHLLVGILNAEYVETREFLPLYGFTQILPGQITTDVIRSADGKTYFDLANSEIGGRITFASGSSGLKNLSEWSGVQSQIDKANEDALKAQKEAEEAYNAQKAFAEQTTKDLEGLQDQIDGNITSWFYEGEPTLSNAPAKDWNTTDLKNNHLGDLYYDQNSGKAYRFQMNGSAYEWKLIADEDITKALELAGDAQDTADAKRRVFFGTSTPAGEKDEGDLWTNGSDLYVWNGTSWVKATEYTDDTTAEAAQAKANEVSEKIDGDNYFTEIEKKSVRSLIAEITECKEKLYERSALVRFTTKQGDDWYKVDEYSRAEWIPVGGSPRSESQSRYAGYYSSNMHTANGVAVMQVDVELTEGREVDIQLDYVSDAESTYDWMTVGKRGLAVVPTSTTTSSNSTANAAGSTYGNQQTVFSKVYNMTQDVDEAKRYFQVAYKKNATTDIGTDSAYFRINNPHFVDNGGNLRIVELKGSFHRYYLLLMQNGYTDVAEMLYDALDSAMMHLYDNGLWTSGTTELADGADFRTKLNQYLTNYYAILASCGFDIMDSKVSDFDYLAGALKDGSKTITEGGLVMTSLVAVGDTSTTNADVEAFMNGSDFCKDNEHGKLIHAMGIPRSVTEDGTEYTDLEKRSKDARTRIYEDGTIISQNAELNEGCTIGGTVKVTADGIEVDNPEAWGKLTISDSHGLLRNDGNLNVQIGGSCSGAGINISNGTPAHGVCYGRGSADNVCATFATTPGKRAIDIFDGMIGGMRPNTVFKSNGETLTHLDHTCFVASGSIYLPSDPQIGQNYRIIHTSSSGLRIVLGSAGDSSFKNIGSLTLTNSFITSSKIEMIELIYDGSNWWYITSRND